MWVVDREVHVLDGAELSIADGTRILILNGVVSSSRIGRAALIFDPGSTLSAARFSVYAGSSQHRISRTSDNGGLWFLGAYAAGASDGIRLAKAAAQRPSLFQAASITVSHLGRLDTSMSPRKGRERDSDDDIDALKLMGFGPDEWQVSQLRSLHSADDGVDLTNSYIRLNRLEVCNPTEMVSTSAVAALRFGGVFAWMCRKRRLLIVIFSTLRRTMAVPSLNCRVVAGSG